MLIVTPAAYEDVARFVEMAHRHDTSAGAVSAQDIANVSAMYQLKDEQGNTVAGYALRVTEHENSRVMWIMAAGGRLPGVDLSAAMLSAIKLQAKAAGAGQIAQITRRPGLVKKMTKEGFEACGTVLRMNI